MGVNHLIRLHLIRLTLHTHTHTHSFHFHLFIYCKHHFPYCHTTKPCDQVLSIHIHSYTLSPHFLKNCLFGIFQSRVCAPSFHFLAVVSSHTGHFHTL